MKTRKPFFVIAILLGLFVCFRIEVSAMNTGFTTNRLPEKESASFLANIDLLFMQEQPAELAITCFDVNEKGMIAIGQQHADYKTVSIFSPEGIYQYGYSFHCSGSFGVEWADDQINIYFVRSDVLITVNQTGEIVDITQVMNTTENNRYRNHVLHSAQRTVGGTTYVLRNDMGLLNIVVSSYSQLIATNSSGDEHVLYDVNSAQFAKVLTTLSFICAASLIAVFVIIRQFANLRYRK